MTIIWVWYNMCLVFSIKHLLNRYPAPLGDCQSIPLMQTNILIFNSTEQVYLGLYSISQYQYHQFISITGLVNPYDSCT